MASLNSSIDTVPSLRASYRSIEFLPAPRSACDTWLSCPGMAVWIERHAWRSTLPTARICEYCSMAYPCSSADLPPASSASLNASAMSVARSIDPVTGAMFCTMPAMASSDVGRPVSRSLMSWMLDAADSDE